MRWRNQILALLCLTIFLALGVLYFRHWVVQKPFGIVLFIGEGLTPDRIAATRLYVGGANAKLSLETLPAMALLSNYSKDFAVPDESAAATTLATGKKLNNRGIGVDDAAALARTTIIDIAREKGRTIGLVTNTRLTNPTVASFYAAGKERSEEVARRFVEGNKIDIALGGGGAEFLPESKGGERRDGRDLILELRRDGFQIVRTKAELENVPRWRRPRLLGLFSGGEMAFQNEISSGGEQPALAEMTRRAIELLQWNPGGYLLIVDAGLMGTAARQNHGEETLAETVQLDRAIAVADSYIGKNSTLLVTGNLGIGGLALNGAPFRRDSGIALLGVNAAGEPALTWATGPNGQPTQNEEAQPKSAGFLSPEVSNGRARVDTRQEPAASYARAARSTVTDVLAAGRGPGSEQLHGFLDNTVIFKIIRDQL
ncbi:MAG: alkaline phosphatase [Chthoniobacterales bacterium]|nr:alkaline phosphatase [Chthoniobacterales bacterium]